MRHTTANSWRRRTFVALLVAFGALVFSVANAFADAGNPILGTIRYSAVDNGKNDVQHWSGKLASERPVKGAG